jgi:hypothetical protein
MMRMRVAARWALAAGIACALQWAGPARAEPYLALASGQQCVACHVNPTGGGLRNAVGLAYAQNVMPAWPLPAAAGWTGRLGELVRLGGDLREQWSRTEVPGQPTQQQWALDQVRLYADVAVIPERLGIYLDQQLAPGSSRAQEAYVRLADASGRWRLKGGQFYLPFGWRLEDDTTVVRQVSGINMNAPDTGLEVGLELPQLSAQLALTNGVANTGTGSGSQLTGQAAWVLPDWRLGVAAASTRADAGDRQMAGLFGGLRTGPLTWLAEVDWVRDAGFPEGRRTLLAAIGEMNWAVFKGHNLKLTAEYFDPDRKVPEDHKTRIGLVWEFTPLPYLQLRAGVRRWDGIPQNALDNRRVLFFELHGFL